MQLDCWPVQVVPSIAQSEQIDPNIDSIDIILFPPPKKIYLTKFSGLHTELRE